MTCAQIHISGKAKRLEADCEPPGLKFIGCFPQWHGHSVARERKQLQQKRMAILNCERASPHLSFRPSHTSQSRFT